MKYKKKSFTVVKILHNSGSCKTYLQIPWHNAHYEIRFMSLLIEFTDLFVTSRKQQNL